MKTLSLTIGLFLCGHSLFAQKTIDVTLTPEKAYVLPDGETKLTVKPESVYLGRAGRTGTVQVQLGESILVLVPKTVIHAGDYRYEFSTDPVFKFGEVREQDMIFTIVQSCSLQIRITQEEAPVVSLKEIEEVMEVETPHGQIHSMLYTLPRDGKHFIILKPKSAEISRFHPDPELGARLNLDLVTPFGARSVRLNYKKPQEVTIGEETITLASSGFDYETKKLKVKLTVKPKAKEGKATITAYGR